jgi:hypothetical protein
MFALIATEQLDELGQVMVKQLKNRYNDVATNRKFVIGIDRAKMKLSDVDEADQQLINTDQDDNKSVPAGTPIRTGGYGRTGAREKPALEDWS